MRKQLTSDILMIKPVAFLYNEQTAVNNFFQAINKVEAKNITQKKALAEFDSMVELLRKNILCLPKTEDLNADKIFWID